jgi:uncharacterized membrane protein
MTPIQKQHRLATRTMLICMGIALVLLIVPLSWWSQLTSVGKTIAFLLYLVVVVVGSWATGTSSGLDYAATHDDEKDRKRNQMPTD